MACQSSFHLVITVSVTATQTLRVNSASRTTARIEHSSCLRSQRAAPCASRRAVPLLFFLTTARTCSVTTVGGTTGIPEVAASFSGGGFSNYVSSFVIQIWFIHPAEMANQSLGVHLTRIRPSVLTSQLFPPANTQDYTTRKCYPITSFKSTHTYLYTAMAAYVYFPTLCS